MTNERFWKSFWILFAGTTLLCAALSASLFFSYIARIDTAAVGLDYTPDKDPFETGLRQANVAVTGGYLYRDALPLALSSWEWDSTVGWRSGGQTYEGSSDIKAAFTKEWGGFGISGFKVNANANPTLSLAVNPDAQVGDLYVELYDGSGAPLVLQSLGWYAPGGALQTNQWQVISIPVKNLLGSSSATTVTAISINTTNPGTAYVDSIEFADTPSGHAPWVYKAPVGADEGAYVPPPFNPFATTTPAKLPYTLVFSPYYNDQWYSPRGLFEQAYNDFTLGPQKGVNADAFAYFRGGRAWSDYQANATVAWGGARVFALIARMQDENNYVSCSYSAAGDTVQMYSVTDGVSTMVTQSDKLHYSDYNGGVTNAGATVQGDTLSCGVDGKSVLTEEIKDMPAQGTVGMEAWDQNDATTAHTIEAFKVVPLVGE